MNILYVSPLDPNTLAANGGYGVVAESFARMFNLTSNITVDYINSNLLGKEYNIQSLKSKYDICIVLTHPDSFNNIVFKNNIESILLLCNKSYLNLFWETMPLPKAWFWLWECDMFDGFIACSEFMLNLINAEIKNTNKSAHLIYVPTFEEDFTNYKIKPENKISEDVFTVLYIGQYTKRKGMEDALTAFVQALSKYSDCRLILKYHELSRLEIPSNIMIDSVIKTNCKNIKAQIYQLTDNLKKDQIYSLYKDSSVLLFPSRGEGYGLPIVEAGMIGVPCIYTNWSSSCEVGDFKGNIKIPYILETAHGMAHYGYEDTSFYAVPSMRYMVEALKEKYFLWKRDKQNYYRFTENNDLEIVNKFGKDVFSKQLQQLLNN